MSDYKTPETDALRDLYENHEHRANIGDIWDLCESLEHRLAEIKRLERERNETANTFMGQIKKLHAQLAVMRGALESITHDMGASQNIHNLCARTLTAPKP